MAVYCGSERRRAGTAEPMVMPRALARARSAGGIEAGACRGGIANAKGRLATKRAAIKPRERVPPRAPGVEIRAMSQFLAVHFTANWKNRYFLRTTSPMLK